MYWSIKDIKRANAKAGRHFFEPATMRFFNSVVGRTVYQGVGGVFFLTSEKGPHGPRRYTVRQFNPQGGDVSTVGEFNVLTKDEATALARLCAQEGVAGVNARAARALL